ncbi:hypothetical protein [Nocardia sp. NPDC049707]|uniref:hypothetical protein n=1 Tax=Nocardia sp. NPDC049707 TaxID=3154735 RepID=UPI003437732A
MNTVRDTELLLVKHRDCAAEVDPQFGSITEARFVMRVHSGHGPRCRQYIAAAAYTAGQQAQDDPDA